MPRGFLIAIAIICAGCEAEAPPPVSQSAPTVSTVQPADTISTAPARDHLVVKGVDFFDRDRRFEWRGITAFRLLEQIAHGGEAEGIAYLDWAGARKVTIVRVLTMAKHLAARAGSVDAAFRLAMAREPTAAERTALQAYAREHGLANACRVILNLNEFVFVD